jgi:hypothetical protein
MDVSSIVNCYREPGGKQGSVGENPTGVWVAGRDSIKWKSPTTGVTRNRQPQA